MPASALTRRKPAAMAKATNATGRKSKADLDKLEDAEITIGEFVFVPVSEVKTHKKSLAKWREITKIYKAAEDQLGTYISSSDNGILNRYCVLYGEYLDLVTKRRELNSFELPPEDQVAAMLMCHEEYNAYRARKLWGIMEYMTSLNALLKLDGAIDRKAKAILDLEDRIFLNPAAKVRTLPIKKKKPKKDPAEAMGFDV